MITKDELWDVIKGDYEAVFHAPLVAVDERPLIDDLEIQPVIIRAAWNYYLKDTADHRYGLSVKRFHKNINRYIAMVKGDIKGVTGRVIAGPEYECEHWVLKDGCGFTSSFFAQGAPGSLWPDVWSEPCRRCGGRMVREGSEYYEKLYNEGMDVFKATDEYRILRQELDDGFPIHSIAGINISASKGKDGAVNGAHQDVKGGEPQLEGFGLDLDGSEDFF